MLADTGINERLTPDVWEKVVASILTGIKKHRQAEAICEGIGKIGHILAAHFPIITDDTNELKGVIIGE